MLTKGPTEREEAIFSEHFAYLQKLVADGVVFMAGRTLNADESSFGIIVFTAESEPAAREIMNDDPAVRADVMKAELFPYRVAPWSAIGPG